jgi:hypothetical protein
LLGINFVDRWLPLQYLRIGLGATLSDNIWLANERVVLKEESKKMKPEDDGLILMVKRDLGAVEASLLPIDAYYRRAKESHDSEKIKRYSDERSALIRARDKLHQEIKELEAFDALQDHHRNAITAACEGLKDKLAHFLKTHG